MYPPDDDFEPSSYETPSREFYVGPRKSRTRLFLERFLPISEVVVGFLSQLGFVVTWVWAVVHAARIGIKALVLTAILPGFSQAYWSYKTFGSPFSFVCIGVALLLLFSLILSRISQSRFPHL
jgi:hypothetical protein